MIPIAIGIIALDRITKVMVMRRMDPGDSIEVIKGYFELTYVHNTGAAFGLLSMMSESYRVPFFSVTTLLALGLLLYFARQAEPGDRWLLAALALIMGGALGNMIDRIFYGHVIDFVDWHVGMRHWPAFNVADSAITVGIITLGITMIFAKGPEKVPEAGTDER